MTMDKIPQALIDVVAVQLQIKRYMKGVPK
jgi:hypothetical protein